MIVRLNTCCSAVCCTHYVIVLPPDDSSAEKIVDVCGDSLQGRSVVSHGGYIESLGYPQPYPPDTRCQCQLVTDDPRAEVILTVLDMQLAPGDVGCRVSSPA